MLAKPQCVKDLSCLTTTLCGLYHSLGLLSFLLLHTQKTACPRLPCSLSLVAVVGETNFHIQSLKHPWDSPSLFFSLVATYMHVCIYVCPVMMEIAFLNVVCSPKNGKLRATSWGRSYLNFTAKSIIQKAKWFFKITKLLHAGTGAWAEVGLPPSSYVCLCMVFITAGVASSHWPVATLARSIQGAWAWNLHPYLALHTFLGVMCESFSGFYLHIF